MSGAAHLAASNPSEDSVADRVDRAVDDRPWLEHVTRVGWLAKGIVYTLMGFTAMSIARHKAVSDDASPDGSLSRVAAAPAGRAMLGLLAVGLLLYFAWRLISVAAIRGNDLAAWGDRVGYSFSGLFYAVLAWTAAKATVQGVEPGSSNTVERLSRTLLESNTGRIVLSAVGAVTMAVGVYFVVRKAIMRSFAEDLSGVEKNLSANDAGGATLLIAGVLGWWGRGVVTALVGFFILRSAVRFDPSDARGFDRALRYVAGTSTGSALVMVCAVGLIAYGVFCLASHRSRTLKDES